MVCMRKQFGSGISSGVTRRGPNGMKVSIHIYPLQDTQRANRNPLTLAAGEVETTDEVVLVFIGREFNPSFTTGLCLLI
jgi:hypothetical protein